MEEVQVLWRELIVAQKDESTNSANKIELTPWDLRFPFLGTIEKGLLFHKPIGQSGDNLIHHLKTCLSHTLAFFPPLTGRLGTRVDERAKTTSFFIDCNNKGAEFVYAIAPKVTMASIVESRYVPCVVQYFFTLNGIRNYEGIGKPLFGVQVTELADGYFIGCTLNHMVGDGASFWHFFNSWSEISRANNYEHHTISKLPDLCRWFPEIHPPIQLPLMLDDKNLFDQELKIKRPLLKERVFHFNQESIGRLKQKANSEVGVTHISSLQAFLAHLWLCVTCARRLEANEQVVISLIIGTRSRVEPALSETYLGNAAYLMSVKTTAGELVEKGLGWAALQMNNMVASQNYDQVLKLYQEWVQNPLVYNKASVFVGHRLGISSSPRFNVYGNDFGWGKPVAVRSGMANKGDGKITLFPGIEEASLDIELCLLPQTLEALGKDQVFMDLVST